MEQGLAELGAATAPPQPLPLIPEASLPRKWGVRGWGPGILSRSGRRMLRVRRSEEETETVSPERERRERPWRLRPAHPRAGGSPQLLRLARSLVKEAASAGRGPQRRKARRLRLRRQRPAPGRAVRLSCGGRACRRRQRLALAAEATGLGRAGARVRRRRRRLQALARGAAGAGGDVSTRPGAA